MPQRLLFDPPARMVHRSDLPTSVGAAIRLVPRLGALLPQFESYGPSTIRKRRSELYQAGELERSGVHRNSRGQTMTVWDRCRNGRSISRSCGTSLV
jgi:hypothetical protein